MIAPPAGVLSASVQNASLNAFDAVALGHLSRRLSPFSRGTGHHERNSPRSAWRPARARRASSPHCCLFYGTRHRDGGVTMPCTVKHATMMFLASRAGAGARCPSNGSRSRLSATCPIVASSVAGGRSHATEETVVVFSKAGEMAVVRADDVRQRDDRDGAADGRDARPARPRRGRRLRLLETPTTTAHGGLGQRRRRVPAITAIVAVELEHHGVVRSHRRRRRGMCAAWSMAYL